jgi:hypothetical protein|tara:strand:- start:1525 stop:2013 length:489 start_codon:yes stop_codon:yes gene_type:complete
MSSSSKSSNTTNNQTTNYSLQGVQGQNIVAGNGNTVTSTDYGSVNAAIGLANSALNSNQIVALSSVDHAGEMAEMAVNATSKAWSGATNLVSEKTADAWSGATKLINDASSANADRVQQMAIAVATDGQNLVAKSNEKNLYIIGGVSVAAVLSMIVMARVKK